MADKEYKLAKPAEKIDKIIQGAVVSNFAQTLTPQQMAQARENIGAGSSDSGMTILGYFDTFEELESTITNPKPGDAYGVNPEYPYDIYIWDSLRLRWVNNGPIRGADGEDGKDGQDGTGVSASTTPPEDPKEGDLWYDPDNDNILPVDNVPTEGSNNLVTSGGVFAALAAYNYLDNSNFEKFVAQAGVGGSHDSQAYAGDRWILTSGTVTGTANANGNGYSGITLNGTIVQVVANPPANGFPVLNMVSGTAEISYANGKVTITSSGGVIKNVGIYSTNYRFAYMPKGYGTELMECQRYNIPLKDGARWRAASLSASAIDFFVPVPCTMRSNPAIVGSGTPIVTSITGAEQTGFSFAIVVASANGMLIRATKSGHGMSDACLRISGVVAFAADLEEVS